MLIINKFPGKKKNNNKKVGFFGKKRMRRPSLYSTYISGEDGLAKRVRAIAGQSNNVLKIFLTM
jgi:hypothetical protein